ncbi:hypothetical protein LMTR3_28235 [Bradyrhizobium sp. LMTR 3]|nr:hypothetical protein LMTR3_28235 [Bradyrhizobium sp. LMTR 3]
MKFRQARSNRALPVDVFRRPPPSCPRLTWRSNASSITPPIIGGILSSYWLAAGNSAGIIGRRIHDRSVPMAKHRARVRAHVFALDQVRLPTGCGGWKITLSF